MHKGKYIFLIYKTKRRNFQKKIIYFCKWPFSATVFDVCRHSGRPISVVQVCSGCPGAGFRFWILFTPLDLIIGFKMRGIGLDPTENSSFYAVFKKKSHFYLDFKYKNVYFCDGLRNTAFIVMKCKRRECLSFLFGWLKQWSDEKSGHPRYMEEESSARVAGFGFTAMPICT